MRLELAGVEVRGRSWAEACATTIENSGVYVVAVITVAPSRTLALASACVADLAGRTAATHMPLPPNGRARSEQRVLGDCRARRIPARACCTMPPSRVLLEELLDEPVRVEIPEESLQHASGVWGRSPPT